VAVAAEGAGALPPPPGRVLNDDESDDDDFRGLRSIVDYIFAPLDYDYE